jgi:hypothetical protein
MRGIVTVTSLFRERPLPDPVKLIRRMCALERAMADLKNDCEQIAERRSKIAPVVIQAQQENVSLVWEVSVFNVQVGDETLEYSAFCSCGSFIVTAFRKLS